MIYFFIQVLIHITLINKHQNKRESSMELSPCGETFALYARGAGINHQNLHIQNLFVFNKKEKKSILFQR
jgi:hypothetical protein